MNYSPEHAALIIGEVEKVLCTEEPADLKLKKLWWTLVFMRSKSLTHDLKNLLGNKVYSGPFKGMQLTPAVRNDNYSPYLLGSYEHELHSVFERAIASNYRHILNIGCSSGYYSVGLARRMPETQIHAFDISEAACQKCRDMATLNKVTDRVTVGEEFHGKDFAAWAGTKTLAVVDVEGAETELLDPERYPALRAIDVIVELHDIFDRTISKTVAKRFAATHDCVIVRNRTLPFSFEGILGPDHHVDPFDSLIATWEMRDGPTPWGIFIAKKV